MKRTLALAGLLLGYGLSPGVLHAQSEPKAEKKPKVEVVFCLDTTGSMGGLIAGAKAKIWSICNQIVSGKPTPELKVGLVAYRDRGDAYVTQVTELTEDLDAMYGKLQGFQAQGGGDGPESVNQALADAVSKIKWSEDKGTLKIIFLVGDAPPHMDYKDDAKYPETCQAAVKKDIIINAIQCGGDPQTTTVWKDVCAKAEGSFAQIAQTGGVVAVATPFDKRLGEINRELAGSTVVFGDERMRRAGRAKAEEAASLPAAPAADRAGFAGKSGSTAKGYDLIDAIKNKEIKLEELKETDLPDDLRKLTVEQRKTYLDDLDKKRGQLQKEAVELDKKRQEYIKEELARTKKDGKDSFDNQVIEMLRKQAKRAKIDY